jgi:hypothetical protein
MYSFEIREVKFADTDEEKALFQGARRGGCKIARPQWREFWRCSVAMAVARAN